MIPLQHPHIRCRGARINNYLVWRFRLHRGISNVARLSGRWNIDEYPRRPTELEASYLRSSLMLNLLVLESHQRAAASSPWYVTPIPKVPETPDANVKSVDLERRPSRQHHRQRCRISRHEDYQRRRLGLHCKLSSVNSNLHGRLTLLQVATNAAGSAVSTIVSDAESLGTRITSVGGSVYTVNVPPIQIPSGLQADSPPGRDRRRWQCRLNNHFGRPLCSYRGHGGRWLCPFQRYEHHWHRLGSHDHPCSFPCRRSPWCWHGCCCLALIELEVAFGRWIGVTWEQASGTVYEQDQGASMRVRELERQAKY